MGDLLLELDNAGHAAVASRLETTKVGWLTTTRRGGHPQSVPVWFAWSDPYAVVFNAPATAKVAHLRRDPRCVLAPETEDGGNDVIFIEGLALMVEADDPALLGPSQAFERKYSQWFEAGFETWRQTFSQAILVHPQRIVAWSKPEDQPQSVIITAP